MKLNRSRILGLSLLILCIFSNWIRGEKENWFWLCHLSVLFLSISLFTGFAKGIRISSFWVLIGLALWFSDIILTASPFDGLSYLTHILYAIGAFLSLKWVGPAPFSWVGGFVWYLFTQVLSRFFTDPGENINLAHSIWPPWDRIFSVYLHFWIAMSLFVLLLLISTKKLLDRFFSEER